MNATLSFVLPEEREEHLRAVLASDLTGALYQVQQMILKMKNENIKDSKEEFLEMLFCRFQDILSDHGIDLEQIYS